MFRLPDQYYLKHEDISELKPLCRGGEGMIYTTTLGLRNQKVAIKSNYDYASLSREAYAMSMFQARYFVKLHGFIPPTTTNTSAMMVMDLYETDLAKVIKKNYSSISLEQKFEWLRDIFRGIDQMHKKGYVHRDLKTSNIFLDSYHQIKIGDFGLSCPVSEMKKEDNVGTLPYMAPELHYDVEKSTAIDIYSLGGLIFHLATGKQPYSGVSEANIVLRKSENNLEPIPEDCHPLFKECISACWSYDPTKRPTAEWLANRFAEALVKIKEKSFFQNQRPLTLFAQNTQDSKSSASQSDQTLELKEVWTNFSTAWDAFDEIFSKKSLYSYDHWKEKVVGAIIERRKQGEVDQALIQKIDECTSKLASIKSNTPEENSCIKNLSSALALLKKVASTTIVLESLEALTPGIR